MNKYLSSLMLSSSQGGSSIPAKNPFKISATLATLLYLTNANAATVGDTIQAENYVNMAGIQTESTSDTGGGLNVGWIDAGDWMTYSITIPTAGNYKVSYRVASPNATGAVQLENAGGTPVYGRLTVPNTGGWQNWTTISATVTLPAGALTLGIAAPVGGYNLNWFKVDAIAASSSSSSTATSSSAKTSSSISSANSSSPSAITVQAEAYAAMSGIQVESTTDAGGGQNIGYVDAGDWLSYPAISLPCAGTYTLETRVASNMNGGSFKFEQAGGAVNYATVTVPNTGGWQTWTSVTQTVTLPAGNVSFGIAANQGGWNLNWFKLTPKSCGASSVSSATSSASSGPASMTARQAANAMGKGFNLGNMFDIDGTPPTFAAAKAKIDAYYALGFRNVRIPITWTEKVAGSTLVNDPTVGTVNLSHPRLSVIKQVVDYALSLQDMYVVINAHHETALKDNNRAWVLQQLWQDIANIFAARDHRLLFELLNEPHLSNNNAMDPANLRNMSILAYAKIRAVDSTRIIIIGGNQWFGAAEMAATWPNLNGVGNGNDAYLMSEFHHYSPWSFNGDNQGDYADNWTDLDMSSPMDTMAAWANGVGKGMPVYIGEWGTGWGSRYSTMQCNNIRMWYQKFNAQYASAKSMPTSVWDDGGWFKIFDFSTYTFTNNLAQCIGGSCAWDGADRFNSGCF